VLAAKAGVVATAVMAAAAVAVPASLLAGRLLLPGHGFAPATTAALWRAAAGSVLYLGLIALLSLGLAALIRNSAAAIGTVLGLLFVVPLLIGVVSDPQWLRHLQQAAPMSAGLAIQATRDLDSLPLSPWAGLGVLAVWAFGALLLGALALTGRDV
jgi:ABC-2 type transport system permease protein